jgi:hypothetical protein
MVLSPLSVKYAKLALGKPKRETPKTLTWNCPLCGDTRGRGSLSAVKDDIGVYGCFNAGCVAEQGMPFAKLLMTVNEGLYKSYRREKFNQDIGKNETDYNSILEDLDDLPKAEPEPKQEPKVKLPEIFQNLKSLTDVPDAVEYVKNRCIPEDVYKHWYFSNQKFIKVLDKTYYVEDFIFIPIIQNEKLSGFYTRSIKEKRFSTILFPNKEKYWSNQFSVSRESGDGYWIFEGIFDALSSNHDKVIAMLSADLSEEVLENLISPIFIFDNDKTGKEKALEKIEEGYQVFVWPDNWSDFKDINEVLCSGIHRDVIHNTIEMNVMSGLQAKIKVSLKKL